jgi:hypothetical protein
MHHPSLVADTPEGLEDDLTESNVRESQGSTAKGNLEHKVDA